MSDLSLVLANLDWRQPLWLLVALQPLLLWLLLRWLQKYAHTQFADSHLLPWIQVKQKKTLTQKIFSRNTAYGFAWVLVSLSLAGPRLPDENQLDQNEINLDVMMVIDLSRSMHATDIEPSRIRRAVLETYEFLSLAKNTRVGVVVYAARAHLLVPLTKDHDALKFYLQDLDSLQLPTKGSDAVAALQLAKQGLQQALKPNQQVVLWLTDGDMEPALSVPLQKLLTQLSAENIRAFILGLATLEGSGVPLADGSWASAQPSNKKSAQAVVTKMDAVLLRQLAQLGKGKFSVVSDNESDWEKLYQHGMLASIPIADNDETKHWHQLYAWFLFPAILLIVIALFPLSFNKSSSSYTSKHTSINAVFLAISIMTLLMTVSSYVYASDNSYSSTVFKGINAYDNLEFPKAQRYFIAAVLDAATDKERAIALHNLGNILFQKGDYAQAIELFSDALHYNAAQQQTVNNQKLTYSLYTILQKRLEKKRLKARMNRFNTATIQGGSLFDLPPLSPSTLNTQTKNLLKFSLPEIPEEELNLLLKKGMAYLQVMKDDGTEEKKKQKEHQQALDRARVYLQNIETGHSNNLWKRLFEVEEGFPAKLESPKNVPGVLPW